MRNRILLLLLAPLLLGWHWFEPVVKKNLNGINAYYKKNYSEALKHFISARGIKPDSPILKNNTAGALYNLKKYKEALEEFSKIKIKESGIPESDFFFNQGNAYFRLNQFDKALEHYKKSMILNPQDIEVKKNYELTLKKMEQQKNKAKKDDKKDDKKDKNKKKEQEKKEQQQPKQAKQQKHKNVMQYLNQKEKKQMEKKKRKVAVAKKEKDW